MHIRDNENVWVILMYTALVNLKRKNALKMTCEFI